MNKRSTFFPALAVMVAAGCLYANAPRTSVTTVATEFLWWGEKDISSGAKTDWPGATVAATPTVKGNGQNDSPPGGLPMTDMHFVVRRKSGTGKPTAESVDVPGAQSSTFADTPTGDGQKATVSGLNVGEGNGAGFTINGLKPGGATDVEVHVTASYEAVIGGAVRESNALPAYEFSETADFFRLGIPLAEHPTILANIKNTDTDLELNSLSGSVLLDESSGVAFISLDVLRWSGGQFETVGATVQINQNSFTVTDFSELSPGESFLLAFGFSGAIGSRLLRVGIEATFAP